MVVAEIPLWLVHTAEAGGAGGMVNPNDAFPGSQHNDNVEQAKASLSLLQNSGRGKKCAIYGVDINAQGNRIATCGGDGTVRIWSVSGLFSRKRARFGDDGNYASSEASGESSPSDHDDDSNSTNNNTIKPTTNSVDKTTVDVEEDEGDEQEAGEIFVHDLSNLVRRKKGGVIQVVHPTTMSKPTSQQAQTTTAKKATAPATSTQKKQQQRLLCTLSAHTGSSVLAVRFSNDGRFLASAGDDGAVCIYTKDVGGGGGAIGNLTDHALEHWSRIKLCRGHGLDVVGLAWAPDDSRLVSCSLDSETPIIVWKLTDLASNQGHVTHSNVICNPYKVLGKGIHTSTVKGVTFDPAGTYLASSGDDPSVCIWRAHDDWGLERRIDSSSGIFRRWKEDSSQSLSSQTLFRRLSWSTDGAYICSTNCVVKNKHVASTISRDGWNVSTARSVAAGAANLVGHKQPVVVSRHCSKLLEAKSYQTTQNGENGENDEDSNKESNEDEPAYATLLALGDRHGFVTVWTTRKSRPIFKLQCSESRCTVTDLAWGAVKDNTMILIVSLLDGHCVALRFKVPEEVGPLLADKNKSRLFKYRYGIDLDDAEDFSRRRLLVGESAGPKFIENSLQMSLESRLSDVDNNDHGETEIGSENHQTPILESSADLMDVDGADNSIKSLQQESQSKGKKRIRPVLMSVDDDQGKQKRPTDDIGQGKSNGQKPVSSDPLKNAGEVAEKASALLGSVSHPPSDPAQSPPPNQAAPPSPRSTPQGGATTPVPFSATVGVRLPYRTSKFRSVDLPVRSAASHSFGRNGEKLFTAECSNSFRIPLGSKGTPLPCIDLAISKDGRVSWRDQIVGTACSALAASHMLLAVGTADGSVQLYGTSPSLGWECGTAFRSHPVLVLGHPIISLQLHDRDLGKDDVAAKLDLLVVSADGSFGVYEVFPELRKRYSGSILPAMNHMSLGATGSNSNDNHLPTLSRAQLTESDQLLLILSSSHPSSRSALTAPINSLRTNSGPAFVSAYGAVQAFIYNLSLEMWVRISDGRFVLSDFYGSIPAIETSMLSGSLSKLDDAVRVSAIGSALDPAHRSRTREAYQHAEDNASYFATRSHCEDRMACALAVRSPPEFKHWLRLYVRTLALGGHADLLRVLVDMLLGSTEKPMAAKSTRSSIANEGANWWLSSTPSILTLDRKSLIKSCVLPEMSKNRALQRLTNEFAVELESLGG